jgi:hypothetical protein
MTPVEAYPLAWPPGRPRARTRDNSRFNVTPVKAFQEIQEEVERLGGTALIISTNVPLRRDGMMMANARTWNGDPGVAVYFTYQKKPMCFACDRWFLVKDNMRAITKTIEALRGIARWGTGDMIQQAFTGFTALPAPESWWQVLGLSGPNATRGDIERAHRKLIMEHHPDRPGGNDDKAARINRARDQGIEATFYANRAG